MNTQVVEMLKFQTRTYDGLTLLSAQTKNRIHAINPDADAEKDDTIITLTKEKGKFSRKIEKELDMVDLWIKWGKNVPGLGAQSFASLWLMWAVKSIPVCQKKGCSGDMEKIEKGMQCNSCGTMASKDGLLKYRYEERDFATVSKWWKFLGRHVVDGAMPKRKKGAQVNWSTKGRTLTFLMAGNFIKAGNEYRHIYDESKKKHMDNGVKKGHAHNRGNHEMIKLFLSHWWHVARTIEGKSTIPCYAEGILQHSGIIAPYYWEEAKPEVNFKHTVSMRATRTVKHTLLLRATESV